MTKIARLKRQARDGASWRGHSLCRFAKHINAAGNIVYLASCGVCNRHVAVKPNPQPNEIDIGGTAVALNCPGDINP